MLLTNLNFLTLFSLYPESVNLRYIILRSIDLKNLKFEISKVYKIGLQRYRNDKIYIL